MRIWDLPSRTNVATFEWFGGWEVRDGQLSRDGRLLVVGSRDSAQIIDLAAYDKAILGNFPQMKAELAIETPSPALDAWLRKTASEFTDRQTGRDHPRYNPDPNKPSLEDLISTWKKPETPPAGLSREEP